MGRALGHLFGALAALIVAGMWLSLLDPHRADRVANHFFGAAHEYKLVLGAGLLAVCFSFLAALRAAKAWYLGVAAALATLGFFVFALSR